MKNFKQQIVFWGIVFLSIWIFSSLMETSDFGGFVGFIVGIIVGLGVLSELNKSEIQEKDQIQISRNQDLVVSDFGFDSEGYTVIYQRGHKGIDHYLRMYSPRNVLPGTLVLSNLGVRFVCKLTRTEQKFTLNWKEIRGATHFTEDNFSGKKSWLKIDTTKYGLINFTTDSATTISDKINIRLDDYKEKVAKEERLIENHIRTRNLDSIPPNKFENLISQLFQSMGYRVLLVGGTGDEGVDLVCKDSSNNEIIVQCKRYKGKVGAPTIRDFYGALNHRQALKGYIVTTGEFTEPAIKWATNKPIVLIGRIRLAELLDQYLPS
jgi:hypothetical protein